MRCFKGSVSIFLALLLAVSLVFLSGITESAKIAVEKSYARGVADMATESVFAEYHITLLETFHIFAIEGTYETGNYSTDNIKTRLEFYGIDEMEWEIAQLQLLTDQNGAAYEEQIIIYMKQKYGVSYLEELFGMSGEWETQRVAGEEVEEESASVIEELNSQVESLEVEEGEEAVAFENAYLDKFDFLTSQPILNLVLVDSTKLSEGQAEEGSLPSDRTLNTGVSSYSLSDDNEILTQMLVSEYILEHFMDASDYLTEDDETAEKIEGQLLYEVEYILAGEDSDAENLESVVNQLILIRTGVNYTCLIQSTVKSAEVSSLALTLATAAGYPMLAQALEQVLFVAWAYGESIMDLRSLLAGGCIELVKSEENWQLSLTNLLNLGEESDDQSGANIEGGLSYSDYLRILIYLENKDNQVLRSLDMIEQRMQLTYELEYFQVDACITQLEYLNICTVTSGYTYEFPVVFSYK